MRKDKRLTGAANAAAAGAQNSNPLGGTSPMGTAPTGTAPGASPQQIPNPLMNPNQQTTNPGMFGGQQQGPQSPNYSQPGRR
jgi:hypothetical protein